MNRNVIILVIVAIALVGAGYFIFVQKPTTLEKLSKTITSTKPDNKIELKLTQGETITIPGTDVKIKAIRVSEICTHVPPPDCGDEATLEFSHVKLSSTNAFTLRRSSKFPPSEETYTFFGHKITVTNVQDTQATLVVEIQKEIPGDTPGWLIGKNSKAGFELQHPRFFEFENRGEVTPSPQLYYNHWLIIRAPGQEFSEQLIVLIYNNVNQNLSEFTNANIFPSDSTPKNSVVGSKAVMESLHIGLDGETKNYFWLDTTKKRGAIFGINPAKAENLSDFYKIIESFKFTQ